MHLLNYNNCYPFIPMHPMIQRGIEKIESEIQEELMEAYELFDTRNKGYIDGSGLSEAMKVLGYQA